MYDVANSICFPVYLDLLGFIEQRKNCRRTKGGEYISLAPAGAPGDVAALGRDLSLREKLQEDRNILKALLAEFCFLGEFPETIPGLNELTGGALEMIRMQLIPIWLVFAFQVQLDIHSILKSGMNIGHRDLFKVGIRASITLWQFFQFGFISPTLHFGDSGGSELLRDIEEHIEIWIKPDFTAPVRNMVLLGMGRKPNSMNSFSLLRQHPILCGSMVMKLNVLMPNRGIALANAKGSIQAVAHLYNAVQHSTSEMLKWADMEGLIEFFREEKVFKGARPTSPKDFFKRYAIMLGFSATDFCLELEV
jgi:hypothetical protein